MQSYFNITLKCIIYKFKININMQYANEILVLSKKQFPLSLRKKNTIFKISKYLVL